jgi:hypothetical protein
MFGFDAHANVIRARIAVIKHIFRLRNRFLPTRAIANDLHAIAFHLIRQRHVISQTRAIRIRHPSINAKQRVTPNSKHNQTEQP